MLAKFRPILFLIVCAASVLRAEDKLGWADKPAADGRSVQTDRGWMVPYEVTVPATDVKIEMLPDPRRHVYDGQPRGERQRG